MSTVERKWLTLDGVPFSTASFTQVWLFALATYGVGDVVTTIALVWFSPYHVEANPVVATAIGAFGGGGFLALKLLSFYACLGIALWAGALDDDFLLFYLPPVVLALAGTVTTILNLRLLF